MSDVTDDNLKPAVKDPKFFSDVTLWASAALLAMLVGVLYSEIYAKPAPRPAAQIEQPQPQIEQTQPSIEQTQPQIEQPQPSLEK